MKNCFNAMKSNKSRNIYGLNVDILKTRKNIIIVSVTDTFLPTLMFLKYI